MVKRARDRTAASVPRGRPRTDQCCMLTRLSRPIHTPGVMCEQRRHMARAKGGIMAGYVIADVRVTDEAGFADFAAGVPASIERHRGRYIIRGGDIDVRQGDWAPPRFVVVEFDNTDAARAWLGSNDYAELAEILNRTSDTSIIVIDGV